MSDRLCKAAPTGWVCSRPDGHPPPCAASPESPQRVTERAARWTRPTGGQPTLRGTRARRSTRGAERPSRRVVHSVEAACWVWAGALLGPIWPGRPIASLVAAIATFKLVDLCWWLWPRRPRRAR